MGYETRPAPAARPSARRTFRCNETLPLARRSAELSRAYLTGAGRDWAPNKGLENALCYFSSGEKLADAINDDSTRDHLPPDYIPQTGSAQTVATRVGPNRPLDHEPQRPPADSHSKSPCRGRCSFFSVLCHGKMRFRRTN